MVVSYSGEHVIRSSAVTFLFFRWSWKSLSLPKGPVSQAAFQGLADLGEKDMQYFCNGKRMRHHFVGATHTWFVLLLTSKVTKTLKIKPKILICIERLKGIHAKPLMFSV